MRATTPGTRGKLSDRLIMGLHSRIASASIRSIETGRSKLLRSKRVAVTTIEGVPEDSPWPDSV